ncbi:MAG TPA: hypothetical protein VFX11_08110 [Candidatus Kapabacteria bacterium]|nr:hypothetical protein [Candidatus Kapabacteria bacterium]
MLSADELLAGGGLTFSVEVPPHILQPGGGVAPVAAGSVQLRPLTVKDLQRISRAAKDSDNLTATLMVQAALVEPALSVQQVAALHVGLVDFLLEQVNRISGIASTPEDIGQAASDPLAKAAFILAREFGWTPQDINNLTLGQVVLHLEMLKQQQANP